MASQKPKGWSSLLSGAVAGLESRLDSILAEDEKAAARNQTTDEEVKRAKSTAAGQEKERSSSRNRANGRLQDRLAKAVAKNNDGSRPGSRLSSETPSRVESPGIATDAGRGSLESRVSETLSELQQEVVDKGKDHDTSESEIQPAHPSLNAPSVPEEPLPRLSTDSPSAKPSLEIPAISEPPQDEATAGAADHALTYGEDNVEELRKKYEEESRQRSEEMHAHLERIDALQAKLQYLAKSAAEAARHAKESAEAGSLDRKLAEKEEQIALLMDEGQTLSKKELQHMTAIKKLRADASVQDKRLGEMKKRLDATERNASEATERARRAEVNERQAIERMKVLGRLEKDVDQLRLDREAAALTIADLKRQLTEANDRAIDAESRVHADSLEAEKRTVVDLTDQLENASIEKKLAEDRARSEIQGIKEQLSQQQEKTKLAESELKAEILNLEGKLEFLRTKSEEVSSSENGDSQVKLLRQIETLQTQYSVARENWQGIENMLNARLSTVEKERDEVARREGELRKRAREANIKSRRAEEELDAAHERVRSFEMDAENTASALQRLQSQLDDAENALSMAKDAFEREKKAWEQDVQHRIDEERSKIRMETVSSPAQENSFLRADSPSASLNRKFSGNDFLGPHSRRSGRAISSDLAPLSVPVDSGRPPSRRTSTLPSLTPDMVGTPQRQDSFPSSLSQFGLGVNGASGGFSKAPGFSGTPPSIHTIDPDEGLDTATSNSPRRTIADMLSVSTVGAGPSVQLVERMSAAVRRLEAEKAVHREELARVAAQRDEAREEAVALMREAEQARGLEEQVARLGADLQGLDRRYETTLQMYGEKSERVEELENDVVDLKNMLRELAESTVMKK
ncbi:hypothetical protein P152DRAFT_456615 [Eremomyces bilateralis CBS 781.70]|uniref:TATA element modulatory factor 1 TATA binding domain-containing protein n=1 Tax=Eremomyces bilateralis CBS 781.70 TaxID=1392243 RepID=A0A6G1G8Z5_9PEZI|nr:uncharacterized protein P152DRAFT_456615 [Eremomyces bilateralis CBS 781.70]KAF1814370.1 hypothetical protein P152DRAFT_456615 [Eremomyces bilateralis CBS 781.70]